MKVIAVLILRAAAGLAAFMLNITLARLLGAEGVGLYTLTISVAIVAIIFARCGIDRTLLRKIAAYSSMNEWPQIRGVYRTGLAIVTTSSVLIGVALYFSAPLITRLFGRPELETPLRWVAFAVLPMAFVFLHSDIIKGLKRVNLGLTISGIMVPFLTISLLLIFGQLQQLQGAILAYLIAGAMTSIFAIVLWHLCTRSNWPNDFISIPPKKLLTESSPLLIVTLVINLQGTIPIFLLGFLSEAQDIAFFQAAVKTALIIGMLIQAVNAFYSPRFAELYYKNDMKALERMARKAVKFPFLAATPILIFLLIYPEMVMGLFGSEFVSGAPLLMVMAGGQFINVITGPVVPLLTMSDFSKVARDNFLLGMGATLIFCLLLIPLYGAMGAAIAHTLGLVLKNLMGVWLVHRHMRVNIWRFG